MALNHVDLLRSLQTNIKIEMTKDFSFMIQDISDFMRQLTTSAMKTATNFSP